MEEFIRTYAVIHMDAIDKNIDSAIKKVGKDTKIMAVIKANAYGHGAIEVAKHIAHKVYGFAVATVREAVELRNSQITNEILILGYVARAEYETVIRKNITFSVLTAEMAQQISECAVRLGLMAKCHIKINTGMNRIGFPADDDTINCIKDIHKLPGIDYEGIFMHFATADEADKNYSKLQFDRFMYVTDRLSEYGINFRIKHCGNSATIIDMPEYRLDMVREGIILYGLKPSDEVDPDMEYHQVMELKSHVIFVKELKKGEPVSYGRTYVTPKDMKVATIAVGYADGYPRSLSSKGYVLIHGKKAGIIGRVCMDQMMVDVTDIPDVKVEDVVTLAGYDNGSFLSIEELAKLSGRFNYEFVCDITDRVERRYTK